MNYLSISSGTRTVAIVGNIPLVSRLRKFLPLHASFLTFLISYSSWLSIPPGKHAPFRDDASIGNVCLLWRHGKGKKIKGAKKYNRKEFFDAIPGRQNVLPGIMLGEAPENRATRFICGLGHCRRDSELSILQSR